jgi:hypothetical protein
MASTVCVWICRSKCWEQPCCKIPVGKQPYIHLATLLPHLYYQEGKCLGDRTIQEVFVELSSHKTTLIQICRAGQTIRLLVRCATACKILPRTDMDCVLATSSGTGQIDRLKFFEYPNPEKSFAIAPRRVSDETGVRRCTQSYLFVSQGQSKDTCTWVRQHFSHTTIISGCIYR